MEEKKNAFSIESLGLSQREFITLFILKELQLGPNYPRAMHNKLKAEFTGKVHSYDYLCKIAKQLAENGYLSVTQEKGKKFFSISEKGTDLYSWYQDHFKQRLLEVKKVIDRFVKDLSGSGAAEPVEYDLPEDYRRFFSKIVSVKDLVRYVTLKTAMKRSTFYMGEIGELLSMKFGWIASNSYLYNLSSEMERTGLLVGQWESEKRTKRFLRITEEGEYHYKQIADAARHRVIDIQHYLQQILDFL